MTSARSGYAFFALNNGSVRLVNLGKTRICNSPSLSALINLITQRHTIAMTDLLRQIKQIKQIADFISRPAAPQAAPSVAQNLMERAELEAGRNPIEAAELRDAARSFLSVIR